MKLLEILKDFKLEDAIKIESKDRQYIALQKMYETKPLSVEYYLLLILANALISFQLSGKGEEYWEEFARFSWEKYDKNNILTGFEHFLKNGKNNRRFVEMKLKRIKKFLSRFEENISKKDFEFYYENMDKLAEKLAKIMNQSQDAKTIVFAVKMFSYAARSIFNKLIYFPENLMIPIDSRLKKLYELDENFGKPKDIQNYYIKLSKTLHIPPLHLDAILWVNYENLVEKLNNHL